VAFRGRRPVTIVALLSLALAAGCGSGSSRSTHAASATGPTGAVPAGYSVYHGYGFSFALPPGFKRVPGTTPGLPAGAWSTSFSPGGQGPGVTNTEIVAIVNTNLQYTVGQVAANLRQAESTDPKVSNLQMVQRATTVPGARAARVVNESYVAPNPHTAYERTWLMVSPKPGMLIDLIVVLEPYRGAKLNPNDVINSFHLGK
jgi:hypothetical protein